MQPPMGRLTGPELKYRTKQALAGIIPIAGLVDHGPHLSSGSDIELINAYSQKASERLHPYLFMSPTIVGSMVQRNLLPLSENAFKAILLDAAKALKSLKIERLVIMSGSQKDLEVSESALGQLQGKKIFLGIWQFYPKIPELEGEDPLATGNPFLTAQMLYLNPTMVKQDMMKYANASFGVSGDLKKATADIGKKIFEQTFEGLVSELDRFMRE